MEPAPSDSPALFDSEFLHKLERFQVLARKVFRGQLRGEHQTRRLGQGIEVADLRRYQAGDDFRYIDWNAYARFDQLFVKLFAADKDLSLHLLLDTSASMKFGVPTKFDSLRRLAAALACIGLTNLDRVSLGAFASELGPTLGPMKGRGAIRTVLRYLETLQCGEESRLLDVARLAAPRLRPRGLVILVSDFLGQADSTAALDLIRHVGHEVMVVQLLAEDDVAPPLAGPMRLVDAEDASVLRVTIDEKLRDAYRLRLAARLNALEGYCQRNGVEYLRATTALPIEDLVLNYLRDGVHFR